MKFTKTLILFLGYSIIATSTLAQTSKILVFSKTNGYRHESIEPGLAAIKRLGTTNGFEVVYSEDSMIFSQPLDSYNAVIFLNTTGDILNDSQQIAFTKFIENGGGFVGIHSATDTEYDWSWYNQLVGAYFESHPPGTEIAKLTPTKAHASTTHLPKKWMKADEWYNFKSFDFENIVILTVDEKSYKGGTMDGSHPISWYKSVKNGRSWYTALGHTVESYEDTNFLQHLLGGINYALGK